MIKTKRDLTADLIDYQSRIKWGLSLLDRIIGVLLNIVDYQVNVYDEIICQDTYEQYVNKVGKDNCMSEADFMDMKAVFRKEENDE